MAARSVHRAFVNLIFCTSSVEVLSLTCPFVAQAGGKPDGAQGVGSEVTKVQDALEAARKYFQTKTSS